ncbi:DUF4112 domain-containing protein [Sphingomonadales bacterium 56]|jgi:hypothetical protein|uniref:DUF4112 domain-containing protein n=1 Tax=unclassified Sphingobium TaxID=2611147 RepID=UPI0019190801|nr:MULTISPECIES: DUF4112 domain-containing protein [unclassified Sphingobium]MBY2928633.1 DUF4112 domain-containing protein [Sphingomonadales bacterium 56]MBY2959519.1 DUF4112 domain-containing protein [Sphingomonadales bacterium 58]CAD7337709.1 hypothetical protein SPHS6_01636 [Sphingobium sp. S6]CAD7339149.1 hypothetical protein SPHS8_02476 [Sphingobium sp. S8]
MALSQDQFDRMVRDMPGFGRDPASVRRRIEAMEAMLEGMFVIPGTNRRVGLDSLVGLIPVVGDIATAAMGAWIVWEARNLGMPKWQLTRMAANVGFDTLVGAIPFAGDVFDFLFKSNTKNLRIIRKHLDKHHPSTVTIEA